MASIFVNHILIDSFYFVKPHYGLAMGRENYQGSPKKTSNDITTSWSGNTETLVPTRTKVGEDATS
jgi:hypothetical protein